MRTEALKYHPCQIDSPNQFIRIRDYLESVDNESRLKGVLKVSETKDNLFPRTFLSGNQSYRLEPRIGPEDI